MVNGSYKRPNYDLLSLTREVERLGGYLLSSTASQPLQGRCARLWRHQSAQRRLHRTKCNHSVHRHHRSLDLSAYASKA